MSVLTIAHLTFLEARQRRLFWIILVVGLASLALFALGFYFTYREVRPGPTDPTLLRTSFSSILLLMALYGVNSLGVMLAVLLSVDTISGEIASGTIQTVVTKPLRRWEIVLGKWLGLAGMLVAFIVVMSASMVITVWAIAQYLPPHLWEGIGLMALEGLFFLTLSILGGTRLSPLGNGVVVFMLYGMAFVAGWVEQFGALLHSETAVNIGIVASLFVPGETMWRRAAYLMQPPVMRELSITPFTAASAPSVAMVVYTCLYIAVTLGVAVYVFGRRDL
jgi:ABC-type transport system involved in multi-copper enzyme maturation permease subunit